MDKTADGKEEVNHKINEKIEKIHSIHVAKDIDFRKLGKENLESTQEMVTAFDKSIRSRWTSGQTKFHYQMFQMLIRDNGNATQNILALLEWVNNLTEAITALWEEIQHLRGIDFENVKARMSKILENPAVQIINNILEGDQEAIKKINERRQKLIKDSVV